LNTSKDGKPLPSEPPTGGIEEDSGACVPRCGTGGAIWLMLELLGLYCQRPTIELAIRYGHMTMATFDDDSTVTTAR
jgi:hypothetical protein